MKYKIVKGTEMFDKLIELKAKIKAVNTEAWNLVEKLGAEKYCKKAHCLAGGIDALYFKEKPEGYKSVSNEYRHLYFPKASNKELLKQIKQLPTLGYDELNSIVEFKAPQTVSFDRGIAWIDTVGITWRDEVVIMDVENNAEYNPPKDVVEILESEYEALKKKSEHNK